MTPYRSILTVCALAAISTSVFAHSGVKDPDVMARMELMSSIGSTTNALGQMAKSGQIDPAQVVENANALAAHASRIEAKFAKQATDPKSESLPAIWTNMDDFLRIAENLEQAALTLAADPESLPTAMRAIGKTCGSCHESYRIEK